MKKILTAAILIMVCNLAAMAQRTFKYENQTEADELFEVDEDEETTDAGVIISCDKKKALRFKSNVDASVTISDEYEEDGQTVYCLLFDVTQYKKRTLTVNSTGYYPLTIDLNLTKQHVYRYEVYDPNDALDATSYNTYREKALSFFESTSYLEAKEYFNLAANCPDISLEQRREAERHSAECDSMIEWRRRGNEATELLDYERAMDYFMKAQSLNSQDRYVVEQYRQCSDAQTERVQKYFDAAGKFFVNKEYEDAVFLYKKVAEFGTEKTEAAIARRIDAERLLQRKKDAVHEIGWEFGMENHLMGLSLGNYRNRTGGYFTLKANSSAFRLINDWQMRDKAEIDITFGWTIPLVKKLNNVFQGLYLHLGPGAAVMNKFEASNKCMEKLKGTDAEVKSKSDVTQEHISKLLGTQYIENGREKELKNQDLLNLRISAAITPEAGLTLKIWRFALRGTYQFRIPIDKTFEDDFKKSMIIVGLGWCY